MNDNMVCVLSELLDIDTKKSPLEKLQCIVKCCNSIFGILSDKMFHERKYRW